MANLKVNPSKVYDFVSKDAIYSLKEEADAANKMLHDKSGKGNDFLGWLNLPSSISDADLTDLEETAAKLKAKSYNFV